MTREEFGRLKVGDIFTYSVFPEYTYVVHFVYASHQIDARCIDNEAWSRKFYFDMAKYIFVRKTRLQRIAENIGS